MPLPASRLAARMVRETAKHVEMMGVTVTLASGATPKAILDENWESVAKAIPASVADAIEGRAGLFHFKPGTAPKAGEVFTYNGEKWTAHPTRPVPMGNVTLLVTVLATAGAVE